MTPKHVVRISHLFVAVSSRLIQVFELGVVDTLAHREVLKDVFFDQVPRTRWTLGISGQELQDFNCIVDISGCCLNKTLNNYSDRMVYALLHKVLNCLLTQKVDGYREDPKTVSEHLFVVNCVASFTLHISCFSKFVHDVHDLCQLADDSICLVGHSSSVELLFLSYGLHYLGHHELD